jgi:hypothetical protein
MALPGMRRPGGKLLAAGRAWWAACSAAWPGWPPALCPRKGI